MDGWWPAVTEERQAEGPPKAVSKEEAKCILRNSNREMSSPL